MKKGTQKAGAKYKSKKMVNGKWIYEYDEPKNPPVKKQTKLVLKKPKLTIKTAAAQQKKKAKNNENKENIGTINKIKSTFNRLTLKTEVNFYLKGKRLTGKIIGSNGTKSKGPTHFDIEYIDEKGNKKLAPNIPRETIQRTKESWYKKKIEDKQLKGQNKQAVDAKLNENYQFIKEQAHNMVMSNWDLFSKMISTYYQKRLGKGFNASYFGFEAEDLKQDMYIVLHDSASSFLKTKDRNKEEFVNYAKSFMKSNLAAKLVLGTGDGGHLKVSGKDQLYLLFFKKVLDEYKKRTGGYPADDKLVDILENERKKLSDEKGNKTVKQYVWNIEKVRNKKNLYKQMSSLDKVISDDQNNTTVLDLLQDDGVSKYKTDPWEQAKVKWIQKSIKEAIDRQFQNDIDKEIIKRTYGLFVEENSPQEIRNYAGGQSVGEMIKDLNIIEAQKGSLKRWNKDLINERTSELIVRLRKDPDFLKQTEGMTKSKEEEKEWSDARVILNWIINYSIVAETLDSIIYSPEYIQLDTQEEVEKKLAFIDRRKPPKNLS